MSVLVDARPHLTAIKTAISETLGSQYVYDHGQVPGTFSNGGTMPNIFVLVALERRASPLLRSARAGDAGWLILTTALGRTVLECEWAQAKIAAALNEQRLNVGTNQTTPIQFESASAARFDDSRFAADAFYTYVH